MLFPKDVQGAAGAIAAAPAGRPAADAFPSDHPTNRLRRRLVPLLLVGVVTVLTGACGSGVFPNDGNTLSFLQDKTDDSNETKTHVEEGANHGFDLAEKVPIDGAPRLIHGDIDGPGDVDVYDLGPVAAGDRIVATLRMAPGMQAAIGLFDDTGTALLINDHRNVYLGRAEPFIDVVVRRPSSACYVTVTSTPGFSSWGSYELLAGKEPSTPLPQPQPDVVLLVFHGAEGVRIGSRTSVDLPPFDAARIAPRYTGQTAHMTGEIVARVREHFAGLDVLILSTSEGDRFERGMTRIYFGGGDPGLLGIAESVDEFNASLEQEAIVFTETFSVLTRLNPTVAQMAQAIANVAGHEIGHLMGLVHTSDPTGIMDVTASMRELLMNQSFTRSPLYSAVFPVGYQDAAQYLLDVLGGDPAVVFDKAGRNDPHKLLPADLEFGIPPVREEVRLSTCSMHEDIPPPDGGI